MTKKIGVFSPSFAPTHEVADKIRRFLRHLGYEPIDVGVISNESGGETHAQNAEESADALVNALHDPNIPLIWMARGGYGSGRLAPHLDGRITDAPHTVLAGYSDATALFGYMANKSNVTCIHAQTLKELSGAGRRVDGVEPCIDVLHAVMRDKKDFMTTIGGWTPLNAAAGRTVPQNMPIFGGNLCLSQGALGTPYEVADRPGWLLLEDVWERKYSVSRMLLHVKQSYMYKHVRGILFGNFKLEDADPQETVLFLRQEADCLDVPVFHSERIGHGDCHLPLILHSPAQMQDGELSVNYSQYY